MQMSRNTENLMSCRRILAVASIVLLLQGTTRTVVAARQTHGGSSSQNVADFSCIGFNLDNITCVFRKPSDGNGVEYNLEIDRKTPRAKNQNATHFYWEARVHTPSHSEATYDLKASGRNLQTFKLDNRVITIPETIRQVVTKSTSDSVTFIWEKPRIAYFWNVSYAMSIQADAYAGWSCSDESCVYRDGINHNITVTNLPYAFHEYRFEVRNRIKHEGSLWSAPYAGTFRTQPCRPPLSPKAAVGGFYIPDVGNNWTIYWQQMPTVQHSGPQFHYVIAELDASGKELNEIRTIETSRVFQAKDQVVTYHIRAANAEGESPLSSVIRVYPGDEKTFNVYRPKEVVTDSYMNSYTLSWKAPEAFELLSNYTVFWCVKKAHTTAKCNSELNFVNMDRHATKFTKEAQDAVLIMAVSANYMDHATGIVWGKCNRERGTIPSKPVGLQVHPASTSLLLNWDWEGGDAECAYLLQGYEIQYTQVAQEFKCASELALSWKSITLAADQLSCNITQLQPDSFYCIRICALAREKGPYSDVITARTNEGAPTAPRNLSIDTNSVTSNSAVLRWYPPTRMNGLLRNYTIWYVKLNDSKSPNAESKTLGANTLRHSEMHDGIINYTLDGLSSYTNYTVYVTAHTASTDESEASDKVHFLTKIAVPSEPRNVKVEKSDSNSYMLEWLEPQMPSGRIEIYEISMITTLKNGSEEEKTATVNARRTATGVYKCRFQFAYCDDTISERHMRVRAINLAQDHEYDHNLPAYDDPVNDAATKESFECDLPDEVRAHSPRSNKVRRFTSSWKNSTRTDMCTRSNYAFAMIFSVILFIFLSYGASLWVRKKYLSMKNINPVLPEGLIVDLVVAEEMKKAGLSSSIEWLMYDDKVENPTPNVGTWNPAANINATNTLEGEDEKLQPHPSDTSSEVQTTQSTGSAVSDSCESQFNNSLSSMVCASVSDDEQEESMTERETVPAAVISAVAGGYVTPALLFNSNSVLAGNSETGSTCESASSGYVQPHKLITDGFKEVQSAPAAAKPNTDGYITAEAIIGAKIPSTSLTTPNGYITANAINGVRSLKPESNELLEKTLLPTSEISVPPEAPTLSNEVSMLPNGSANDSSHSNSNSVHNLISGYVTQQQLAQFRQLMH